MTVIAGIVDDSGVYLAADSCFDDGEYVGSVEDMGGKIVDLSSQAGEPCLVGVAGQWVLRTEVSDRWKCPKLAHLTSDSKAMAQFAAKLRQHLASEEALARVVMKDQDDGKRFVDGFLLVAFRGALWTIWPDLAYSVTRRGWEAIGSGEAIAKGVLFATRDREMSARERLTLALEAASTYCRSVAPPFQFVP